MTSDVSGRPLLFGGCCWTYGEFNDTWRGDGGRWKRLNRATTSGSGLYPPGREAASMAFDAARGQVVLFGGLDFYHGKLLGDTWTWNGTTWTQRHPATSPSARLFATMGYNPKTRQVVLFGGSGNNDGSDGETWTWDGSTWTRRQPATSPSPRISATMAPDVAGGGTVLFSGISCNAAGCTAPNDTWTWDGTSWTLRFSPLSPTGRVQASMATDRARNRVVLFGGANQIQGQLRDTWTWDGAAWTQQLLAGSPPARQGAGMAYDATTKRVALFGGLEGCCGVGDDTWTWDGSMWSEVRRSWPWATVPSGTYDAARQQGVLFELGPPGCTDGIGGTICRGHTWTWNGSSWTDHATGSSPPVAAWQAMAFDMARARVVLFGGQRFPLPDSGSIDSRETWTWDGTAWTKRNPKDSPSARRSAQIAYDARNKKIVLFGGISRFHSPQPDVMLGDTWTWDGTNWRREHPSTSPAARVGAGMAYDEATGEVVLFGGIGSCASGVCRTFDDTWTWNGRNWTRRPTTSSPGPRSYAALGYDRPSRTAVLFGGLLQAPGKFPTFYNDTWAWNGSTWTRRDAGSRAPSLSVPGRPSGHNSVAVVGDRLGRVVLFGGGEYGKPMNDMWTYGGG